VPTASTFEQVRQLVNLVRPGHKPPHRDKWTNLLMTRETRQEREKRLAEALRRNLNRRKQATRGEKNADGAQIGSDGGSKREPDQN
jgi:hypothetical protein